MKLEWPRQRRKRQWHEQLIQIYDTANWISKLRGHVHYWPGCDGMLDCTDRSYYYDCLDAERVLGYPKGTCCQLEVNLGIRLR
jgi:hypothetical protein